MRDFVVDTTDNRMIYIRGELIARGYRAYEYSTYEAVKGAIYIFSPAKSLKQADIDTFPSGSTIYAGRISGELVEAMTARNITYINLLTDEVYAYENAMYTAEVALMLIIRNTTMSILDMSVLILGYGRVGKAVANMLSALGVKFAIAARRMEARASAHLLTSDVRTIDDSLDGYDVIINTIPARIIDRDRMDTISHDSYILDLASYDVMDRGIAEEMELSYAVEHGLPGRYTPKSAGDSLIKSVLRTLEV